MAKSKEEWKVYKNVFSEFSLRTLFKLSTEGHFEELESPVLMGKEANIFSARTANGPVIVKIYRLENCNFNKMYEYIASDPRYNRLPRQKRSIVFSWTQREFKNLMVARESIRVPTPITFKNNIIVMEMIGNGTTPSPMVKDARPKDPKVFLLKVVDNVNRLWKSGLVHGDLSEFNILNKNEEPIFIDFSQATYSKGLKSRELLTRDVENLRRFFKKLMPLSEVDELLKKINFNPE